MKLKNVHCYYYTTTHTWSQERDALLLPTITCGRVHWWKDQSTEPRLSQYVLYLSGRHYIWLPDLLPAAFLFTNVSVRLRHLIAPPIPLSFHFIKLFVFLGKKVWERTPTCAERNNLTESYTARGEFYSACINESESAAIFNPRGE